MFNKDISHMLARYAAATLVVMAGVGIFSASVGSQGGNLSFKIPQVAISAHTLTALASNTGGSSSSKNLSTGFISQKTVDEQRPYPVQSITSPHSTSQIDLYRGALARAGVSSSSKFYVSREGYAVTVTGNRMLSLEAGLRMRANSIDEIKRATDRVRGIYFFDENTQQIIGSIQNFDEYEFIPSPGISNQFAASRTGKMISTSAPVANRSDRMYSLRPLVVVNSTHGTQISLYFPYRFAQFILSDGRSDFEGPASFKEINLPSGDGAYNTMTGPIQPVSAMRVEPASTTIKMKVGEYKDQLFKVSGASNATWKIVSGSLPFGVELKPLRLPGQTNVAGTPTQAGTYYFTLRATDAASSTRYADAMATIEVQKAATTTARLKAQLISTEAIKSFVADASGEKDMGTFKISYSLTAQGGDIYVPRSTSLYPRATSSLIKELTTLVYASTPSNKDTSSAFVISEGETRNFTFAIDVTPVSTNASYELEIEHIKYATWPGGEFTNIVTTDPFSSSILQLNVFSTSSSSTSAY